jgi:hypothetical protein
LITDRSRGEEPVMLFSGGALLVGDVARPDLLGGAEQTRRNAAMFCHTLRDKVLALPDFVEVYPTHVAGSLCGGSIGSRLSTTIGYERRMNRLLSGLSSAEAFSDRKARLSAAGTTVGINRIAAFPPAQSQLPPIAVLGTVLKLCIALVSVKSARVLQAPIQRASDRVVLGPC